MENNFDVIIIGGGPGGYVAAIRAAQLGNSVALIEKRKTLGGTCLNVGCIPSKALLDSSEVYAMMKEKSSVHGIAMEKLSFDLAKMQARKDQIVSEVCQGVDFLIKKNKIKRYLGTGVLKNSGEAKVVAADGKEEILTSSHILIATGSQSALLPHIHLDGKRVLNSDQVLGLNKVPKELVVIGAGSIGLELASVWNRLGTNVTFVELLPGLFGGIDKQVSSLAKRIYESQGLKFIFGHKVTEIISGKDNAKITVEGAKGEKETLEADIVMSSVGRVPYVDGLGALDAGIKLNERGRIEVNPDNFETSQKGIYAIGDCIDGPMLAHKASEEGLAWAEKISGKSSHVNYRAIPSVIYTHPEVAWVGEGEEQLKKLGIDFKVGKFQFRANARSRAMNESEGMVKILADKKTDKLLGAFIIGPRASELIHEAVLVMEFGGSSEDIARMIHAHPTLSEAVKEASMAVDKWSIHS